MIRTKNGSMTNHDFSGNDQPFFLKVLSWRLQVLIDGLRLCVLPSTKGKTILTDHRPGSERRIRFGRSGKRPAHLSRRNQQAKWDVGKVYPRKRCRFFLSHSQMACLVVIPYFTRQKVSESTCDYPSYLLMAEPHALVLRICSWRVGNLRRLCHNSPRLQAQLLLHSAAVSAPF